MAAGDGRKVATKLPPLLDPCAPLPSSCPAAQLVAPDGVLDRNFSLLGPGDTEVSTLGHPACSLSHTHHPSRLLAAPPTLLQMRRLPFPTPPFQPSVVDPRPLQAGEVLLKDSMHVYKFWASGRRFCQVGASSAPLSRRAPCTRPHTHAHKQAGIHSAPHMPLSPRRACWPRCSWCGARTCWPTRCSWCGARRT